MYKLPRSWLVGVCLGLLAACGIVKAQTPIEVRHTPKTVPKNDLGRPVAGVDGTNGRLLRAGTIPTGAGGTVTFTQGETAVRYPSTDLSLTTDVRQGTSDAEPVPQGTKRAIMPPVSAEESQRARSSRVFPSNLNEGVSLDTSAATNGPLKATGITGDTNARGPASIAELARSLRNDPDLIYEYVKNNIEFYPNFGVQKGALGAVLDNQGTAYDQAMLMVELLRASSIPANFVSGYITLTAQDAASWYGVDTSNACAFGNLLGQAQLPFQEVIATTAGQCPGVSAALVSVTVEHVWVKAKIDGKWFVFDPSFKTHTMKAGIDFERANPAGYNASAYWNMALSPSSDTADWVQNIGRTNIRNNLTSYANNLANYLRKNNPTATLDDVIGGKTIDPFYGSIREMELPYQDKRWSTVEFAEVPNSVKPTVRIQYQGIDQTFTSDAIYGRRLTITYANQGQALLKLDGSSMAPYAGNPVATGTPTTITFTVSHNAYASPFSNQTFTQTLIAGGTNTYLIANSWGPSGRGTAENYRSTISDLRASGTADTAEPLLGSTLALIGAQWVAQTDQTDHVTAQLAKSVALAHHRVGIVGYAWDNAGRLIRAVADGRTLSYQYDANGNRTRLTWPDGFFVTTDYDSLDRPVLLKDSGSNYLANYFYDMLDRRTAVSWQSGVGTAYEYSPQGLISGLSHTFNAPVAKVQFTYARNQAGDLSAVSSTDDRYQWSGAVPGTRGYVTNGLNQYKSTGGDLYCYSTSGNLTFNGSAYFTYDLNNRLRGVTGASSLEYDPEGRLQQTRLKGITTVMLYDGNNLIAEYDDEGVLQRRYVHGPGTDEPIVSYEGAGTTARTRMLSDHLGSIVATVNENGASTGVFSYGPNGQTAKDDGPRFRFTGQQYLRELGLYYYKARMYSPALGRFLQTDPVGMKDDLNLYAYVGNNPVNRVDPTGLAKVDVGSKTPTQVAAAGGCQGFSGGCQNGGSYGTTAAYEVDNRYVCTNCAIKLLGIGGQPAAVQTETLQLFIREGQK